MNVWGLALPLFPGKDPQTSNVKQCCMETSIDLLQWPAMLVTVCAAWLVASSSERKRNLGFWVFLTGNALWIGWGWYANAYALIVLQVCLAVMNIRGVRKNEP